MMLLNEEIWGFHFMQEKIRRCEGKTNLEELRIVKNQEAFKEWTRLKEREPYERK